MTAEEFSNEFDILLNSYDTAEIGQAQGKLEFDEYEKSVFLTKAQEELVISLYDGRNSSGESFENTEEARRSLSSLVKTYTTTDQLTDNTGLSTYSKFYALPSDLWYITYEAVTITDSSSCLNNSELTVTPVTQDAYYKQSKNPFKRANNRRALRLDVGDNIAEIISKYTISKYLIRYLSKPSPIITTSLTDNLSINGVVVKSECKLNPVMHRTILERAVRMAFSSRAQSTGK